MDKFSIGPSLFGRMTGPGDTKAVSVVEFVDHVLSRETKPLAAPVVSRLAHSISQGINDGLPLMFANYILLGEGRVGASGKPSPDDVLSLLLIMWHESSFRPTLVAPNGAFGIMMLLPSSVKDLTEEYLPSGKRAPLGTSFLNKVGPILPSFLALDAAEGERLSKGYFVVPLTPAHPFDQVMFLTAAWKWHSSYIDKYFHFDGERWRLTALGTKKVKFAPLLKSLSDPASTLWNDYATGRHILHHMAWLQGPGGFQSSRPALEYWNDQQALPLKSGMEFYSLIHSEPIATALNKGI